MFVEHLRDGQPDHEDRDELRDLPVPVIARLLLKGAEHDGQFYGWGASFDGAKDVVGRPR